MTAWSSRYTLVPRMAPNALSEPRPREGALLRIDDGFADLHPWPELGDPPLQRHLASIASGRPTRLAQRSLACAAADADARRLGVSLFDGFRIPDSHYSAGGGDLPDFRFIERAGFDRVKVKAGPDLAGEIERLCGAAESLLETTIRLRIDFNASIDATELTEILTALPARMIERIEFLEDPVPADPVAWSEIRRRWGLRIAADREKPDPASWDVAIIKPAWESDEEVERALGNGKPLVFTSAMDHPVGQMWAAWKAAAARAEHPGRVLACGLLSHGTYEPNDFSARLEAEGPALLPPEGTGLGFDDLLESLDWKRLH